MPLDHLDTAFAQWAKAHPIGGTVYKRTPRVKRGQARLAVSADTHSSPVINPPPRAKRGQVVDAGAAAPLDRTVLEDQPRKRGPSVTAVPVEALPAAAISQRLVGLQHRRKFCITQQVKLDNATLGFIRYHLGQTFETTEKVAKEIAAKARRIKATIEKAEGQSVPAINDGLSRSAFEAVSVVVLANQKSRMTWDELRIDAEKAMEKLAKQLPVWSWVKGVKGVGPLGLAVIAAEAVGKDADDLGQWRNRANLQKHLGLGIVRDGTRQRKMTEKAAAIEHGYSPRRRAQCWAFLDDVMLRSQWQGGEPVQIYGQYYRDKKAEYLRRWGNEKGGAAHADKAARRYMAKMFIRDLYNAWRRAEHH